MNFLLNSNLGENLALGGEVVLVGIATVFAVLGIIWACLVVFKFVFHDMKQGSAKVAVESKKDAPAAVAYEPTVTDDTEIIAVIAAAICAAETENLGLKFRVVSYRRK